MSLCNWQNWYKMPVTRIIVYITYNMPYVALMRLYKLQMKHIPLGMVGKLIVQEFT